VRDDGVGGARPEGSGLVGLADRLAALDGLLQVETPSGGGTVITAAIPLTGSDAGRRHRPAPRCRIEAEAAARAGPGCTTATDEQQERGASTISLALAHSAEPAPDEPLYDTTMHLPQRLVADGDSDASAARSATI
jgi:hypothetical protein